MTVYAGISYLRIFATISVIWLHTCSTLTDNLSVFDLSKGQIAFFSSSYQMMYWAVPCFFMITGALMLAPEKEITSTMCVKKYLFRLLLALLFFGIPFAGLKLIMENQSFGPIQIILVLKAILENSSFGHLWYLYTLMGIYLILPLLKKASNDEGTIRFLLKVLLIVDFCFPLISGILGVNIALDLPLKYPVFYIFSGYYFSRKRNLFSNKQLIIISIICIALIWTVNYMGLNSKMLTAYNSPLTAILSISIFNLFIGINQNVSGFVWRIDRLCFGVYLIHPLFIQFGYRFLKITPANFHTYPFVTLLFFIFFVICAFAASYVMNKIAILRKYIL